MCDLLSFILPDCSKCGAGLGFCIPAWKKTFSFLTTMTEEEDAGNTNSWSHEWWDVCGDPMLCVLTVFACGNYYIPVRTSEAALKETSCEGYFCGTLATCWCAACYFAAQRREMRNKYKIKGSACGDLLMVCLCGGCALCQATREAGLKEPPFTVPLTNVGAGSKPAAAPVPQEMGRDNDATAAAKSVPEEEKAQGAKPKVEETKPGM